MRDTRMAMLQGELHFRCFMSELTLFRLSDLELICHVDASDESVSAHTSYALDKLT